LLFLHTRPIKVVFYYSTTWEEISWGRFLTYMHSAIISSVFSYPALLLAKQLVHQGYVQHGPLVLEPDPLTLPKPTADRDRTVSRRSEPNSRTTLIGEQPNPWDHLQPQDVMSRHRGAKRARRYGRLELISLLSPEYLLSVEW